MTHLTASGRTSGPVTAASWGKIPFPGYSPRSPPEHPSRIPPQDLLPDPAQDPPKIITHDSPTILFLCSAGFRQSLFSFFSAFGYRNVIVVLRFGASCVRNVAVSGKKTPFLGPIWPWFQRTILGGRVLGIPWGSSVGSPQPQIVREVWGGVLNGLQKET